MHALAVLFVSLVLCCAVSGCTVPVLFCVTYLTYTSFLASFITCAAPISFPCPSLVAHLCVFSLCAPLSLCQLVFVLHVKRSCVLSECLFYGL